MYQPTSFIETLLDSPLLFIITVAAASLLVFIVIAMIAAFFDKTTDPYADLSEKSLPARAAIATALLSACLPQRFTGKEKPARVIYHVDAEGHVMIKLSTAGGAPIVAPGELLAVASRIISPQVPTDACGVFDDDGVNSIHHHLGEHDRGASSLDALNARYEPLACEDSAMAKRRAERSRSMNTTNTAIIAANTAVVTSLH